MNEVDWEVLDETDDVRVAPDGRICHYKVLHPEPKKQGPKAIFLAYLASIAVLAYALFVVLK